MTQDLGPSSRYQGGSAPCCYWLVLTMASLQFRELTQMKKSTVTAINSLSNTLSTNFVVNVRQKEIIWRQDNARPHVSQTTIQFFRDKQIVLSKQAPYSPDLNGCDHWLNKWLKLRLKQQQYENKENLFSAARQALFSIEKTKLLEEVHKYIEHCENVIRLNGDYTVQ